MENNFICPGSYISVFQKEENKYMYIPNQNGDQKHTFRNIILGKLWKYITCSKQKFNFLKINNFFRRLRLRGHPCFYFKRLFKKVKHSSSNDFLKFPPQEGKFYSPRKENIAIEMLNKYSMKHFQKIFFIKWKMC